MTRLSENIKDFNAQGCRRYTLSISVGTTQFDPNYPIPIEELLSKADALMYVQKRERRGNPSTNILTSSNYRVGYKRSKMMKEGDQTSI
jgi:GGDEF domain-containing protein